MARAPSGIVGTARLPCGARQVRAALQHLAAAASSPAIALLRDDLHKPDQVNLTADADAFTSLVGRR